MNSKIIRWQIFGNVMIIRLSFYILIFECSFHADIHTGISFWMQLNNKFDTNMISQKCSMLYHFRTLQKSASWCLVFVFICFSLLDVFVSFVVYVFIISRKLNKIGYWVGVMDWFFLMNNYRSPSVRKPFTQRINHRSI